MGNEIKFWFANESYFFFPFLFSLPFEFCGDLDMYIHTSKALKAKKILEEGARRYGKKKLNK